MKVAAILVVALVAAASAQIPARCSSPKQWEGRVVRVDTEHGSSGTLSAYSYDATGLRKHFYEISNFENKTAPLIAAIFNHRENVGWEWEINDPKKCKKFTINRPWIPHAVPENATFIADYILGSSALAGAGVEIEVWDDTFSGAKWYAHFTRVACVPTFVEVNFADGGKFTEQFLDITVGIHDPNHFIPPSECPQ